LNARRRSPVDQSTICGRPGRLFIISETPVEFGDVVFPIAEGAREVHQFMLEESRHHDIPTGMVWGLGRRPAAHPDQRCPRPRPGLENPVNPAVNLQ
jgi:hypothetical protein